MTLARSGLVFKQRQPRWFSVKLNPDPSAQTRGFFEADE